MTPAEAVSFLHLLTTLLTDADIEAMRRLTSGWTLMRYGAGAAARAHGEMVSASPEHVVDLLDFRRPRLVHVLCGDLVIGCAVVVKRQGVVSGPFEPNKAFHSIYHFLLRTIPGGLPRQVLDLLAPEDAMLRGWPKGPLTIESARASKLPVTTIGLLEHEWVESTGTSLTLFVELDDVGDAT